MSLLCKPVVFSWKKPVFFNVVYLKQLCFEAVSEVSVDFFAVKMEAAVIKLIHITCFLSEHVKKFEGLHQVAEFGAFFWTTTHQ